MCGTFLTHFLQPSVRPLDRQMTSDLGRPPRERAVCYYAHWVDAAQRDRNDRALDAKRAARSPELKEHFFAVFGQVIIRRILLLTSSITHFLAVTRQRGRINGANLLSYELALGILSNSSPHRLMFTRCFPNNLVSDLGSRRCRPSLRNILLRTIEYLH
jgi:hypothetical protein